jgi:hypothetical protein
VDSLSPPQEKHFCSPLITSLSLLTGLFNSQEEKYRPISIDLSERGFKSVFSHEQGHPPEADAPTSIYHFSFGYQKREVF